MNIVDGGALTILSSFIEAAHAPEFADWQFVVLSNPMVKLNFGRIKRINFALPKKSWLLRVFYEYVIFKKISTRLNVDIWFSLHDLTPNVIAKKRFVYCHNPAPFYRPSWRDVWLDPKFFIFNKLYSWFYRLNINKNDAVIVQQFWLKLKFLKFCKVPVHVSHPKYVSSNPISIKKNISNKISFLYPAFPRFFKNHQIICEAISSLSEEEKLAIKVIFTMSGSENRYAAWLKKCYGNIEAIEFRGKLTYLELQQLYQEVNCVIFPSKLETWGLPLTEARYFGKDIICANLPYAIETLGNFPKVHFVAPDSVTDWSNAIRSYYKKPLLYNSSHNLGKYKVPDSVGFRELLIYLVNDSKVTRFSDDYANT